MSPAMKNIKLLIIPLLLILVQSCQRGSDEPIFIESSKKAPTSFEYQGCIEPDTFIKLAKKVAPAVVNINTSKTVKVRNPFGFFGGGLFDDLFEGPEGDREMKQQSLGSGFIISRDGYIVTNNHVVEKSDEISVTLQDGEKTYEAKVIGGDKKTDVALIKIDAKEELKPVVIGDSSALQVGEVVVAIGNPFGLSHTVTQGIVSAKQRVIGLGNYDSFIQTDASINPGNSGGPLLNIDGEVVGINTAIIASGQGIGFSIPINLAKNIIKQIKETGKVTRAWIGVMIQKVTEDLQKSLGLKRKGGALVSSVIKDGPADKAGIENGDVIVSFNGKEINDFNELPILVSTTPVGQKCDIVVIRDGKERSFTVTLEQMKDEGSIETVESGKNKLGIGVEDLSSDKAREFGLPDDAQGVLITGISPDSPAAGKGLRKGDLIVEINKENIKNIKDFNEITKRLKKGQSVLMFIRRGASTTLYIAFTL